MKRLTEMLNANGGNTGLRLELRAEAAPKLGFRPAFLDFATMRIYPSQCADGRPAPFHCRNTLPDAIKERIVAGFERGGYFYTRRAAARACEEWGCGA